MHEVFIAPLARHDIKNIGRYTQKNWGVDQRNHYLGTLDKTINGLLENHRLDRKRDYIKQALLSCSCQEYMIFFRRNDVGNVEVLRIPGQSMDFQRHL